jgi:copper chaperone CopZ
MQMARDTSSGPFSEAEFSVPSIVCDGCAQKVRDALEAVPGVEAAKVKLWRKRVHIRYRPSVIREAEIKDALEATGFPVEQK